MTKNNARMLTTILTCCLILVSCSNNDNSSEYIDHISGRTYHLDQKVVNRRECHALKMIANDVLNLKFRQIVFEYTSVGPDMKTPVRLTGVISMPPDVYNKVASPRGLMLYNEFTCAKHGERTSQNEIDDIGLYMNKYQNLIMVSADLYGWTLTEDKPQAYCCPEITSVETIDAWDAAMQILKDEGYAISGLPTFNVGYSSGGFSALAVQRYCDEKRPDLHWNLTSGGAAPFDLHSVYISNITSPTSGYACSFPLVVVAYKETYHMDFEYSKDYGTWDINKLIAGGDEAKAKDCPVNLILTPDALNPQSTVGKKLAQKLRENSLCGEGQTWQPSTKTKYYIMHSAGDKYMDWHVGEEMANYLKDHGCNVETEFGDWGNHVDYGLFQHIGKTILLMEDCMPDKDAAREQAIKDAIDKAKEYIRDKVYDMTGIPL